MKRIFIFLIFVNVVNIYAQNSWSIRAGYGLSKYDVVNAKPKNSYYFGIAKKWMIYKHVFISSAIDYTTCEIFVKDVIIRPRDYGVPVKIYKNDFSIKMNYFELPVRLGISFDLIENLRLNTHIGFALAFAHKTERKIENKNLLYEGDVYGSGLRFNYSIQNEGDLQNYHVNSNWQAGLEFQYKKYGLGFLVREYYPYGALALIHEISENLYSFQFTLSYIIF